MRLIWKNAPPAVAPDHPLPIRQIRDPSILYRLVPGSSGWYNGTRVDVNAAGLRDRDYSEPAPAGISRILVLGDSMVFGVGLRPEDTLPAQLARRLDAAEAINSGIFGYNLTQQVQLLRDVGPRYRPDVVVACFVHNDIENWGLGDGGAVPEIVSSRFEPPPAEAWSTRLADLMLPETFDPERLNLLPGEEGAGLRNRLASISRLYLFTYMRLRTHSWSLSGGERREPVVESPACRTEEVIWEPLRDRYRELRAITRESGASLVVVILGGWLWEGYPLEKLHGLLASEGIPFLDLTPVWLDAATYAAEFSLGWDPHPSAKGNAVAAGLIAEYLRRSGLAGRAGRSPAIRPPGPHDVIEDDPAFGDRLGQWRDRQREAAASDRERWESLTARLSPSAAPGDPLSSGQLLHGFWNAGGSPPPPPDGSTGLWMSRSGAVLLGNGGNAGKVIIDLDLPGGRAALDATPDVMSVTLGAPPAACGLARVALPVGRRSGPGRYSVGIPPELIGAEPLEIRLEAASSYPASLLEPGSRDPRRLSWFVTRIALE